MVLVIFHIVVRNKRVPHGKSIELSIYIGTLTCGGKERVYGDNLCNSQHACTWHDTNCDALAVGGSCHFDTWVMRSFGCNLNLYDSFETHMSEPLKVEIESQ